MCIPFDRLWTSLIVLVRQEVGVDDLHNALYSAGMSGTGIRNRAGDPIIKSNVTADYNKAMNWVNRSDQLATYAQILTKTCDVVQKGIFVHCGYGFSEHPSNPGDAWWRGNRICISLWFDQLNYPCFWPDSLPNAWTSLSWTDTKLNCEPANTFPAFHTTKGKEAEHAE